MNKLRYCILLPLVAAILGLAGCGKSVKSGDQATSLEINGVKVDTPKLFEAFPSPTPEQNDCIMNLKSHFRYGMYDKALMELDKLQGDAGVTDAQKKIIATVMDQVKELITKQPAQ